MMSRIRKLKKSELVLEIYMEHYFLFVYKLLQEHDMMSKL